ncbi:glycosyltransferase family 2 protein [Leeuwenhoekiella marinoflava]|uniref:Glycosyltransferase involved in cell wall biosynthesis n=2 Tax=Leeuwenhoekiella marinoflava TaxID=988 RepID=A0A4Q0PIK5_9FLAO|nr:glycosyltransferase family 2 protein [Leeuwenhoekiella marinoflava]RXG26921.1 glycosyltransferase involved in cell wall biosynthesis [Leeuwenhoekiella marinoflava]SHF41203.1 Glycosyltransferase involved in cell wall bisynthesis [Leeuwenhoekiella marinoflava DSM 3653]
MESNKSSKVTILLATFNRAHLILETLESIKNQTYRNFECLITDDNSIDDTELVVNQFIKTDSRFLYFEKPSTYIKGLSATRNYGLDLAKDLKSKFILFVDDDDILHPQNLEICTKAFDSNNLDFIHYKIKPFNNYIKRFSDIREFKRIDDVSDKRLIDVLDNIIPLASCSVMWRKTALQGERFKEGLYYAEELEFYSRLLIKERKGGRINVELYYNRKHEHSNTAAFFNGNLKYTESLIRAYQICIDNLIESNKMNYTSAKFFVWKAVVKKEKSLYQAIMRKSALNAVNTIRLWFLYNFSGVVGFFLKMKKGWRTKF